MSAGPAPGQRWSGVLRKGHSETVEIDRVILRDGRPQKVEFHYVDDGKKASASYDRFHGPLHRLNFSRQES